MRPDRSLGASRSQEQEKEKGVGGRRQAARMAKATEGLHLERSAI